MWWVLLPHPLLAFWWALDAPNMSLMGSTLHSGKQMDGTFHVPNKHQLNSNRRAELGAAVHGVEQPQLQGGEGQGGGHGRLEEGGRAGAGQAVAGLPHVVHVGVAVHGGVHAGDGCGGRCGVAHGGHGVEGRVKVVVAWEVGQWDMMGT